MTILRTPDERLALLPFFPFVPRYLDDLPGYAGCAARASWRSGSATRCSASR
jgi:hypothetical protein